MVHKDRLATIRTRCPLPELERALETVMDAPPSPPASISELERRVSHRRRRHRLLGGAAVSATLLAMVALAPGVLDRGQEESTVRTGPASDAPIVGRARTPSRVSVDLPSGWETLYADGDRLVLGTRPLQERDLLLAGLARDDAAFRAFPADGVVVVVGGDPTKAKYVGDPSSETRTTVVSGGETTEVVTINGFVGPGPALALGPAKALPGEVTVRLGDVPQSSVSIAAYAGRASTAGAMKEAEAIAATVRLTPQTPAGTPPPPPPPGSRPGFDQGDVGVPAERLQPVASVTVPGAVYTVGAENDCAVVTSTQAEQPRGGGCASLPPAGGAPAVVAVTTDQYPPAGPGAGTDRWPATMLVLLRVPSGVDRVTAELVDGRVIEGTVGSDGWALVATDGRPFLVQARDGRGHVVARTAVR